MTQQIMSHKAFLASLTCALLIAGMFGYAVRLELTAAYPNAPAKKNTCGANLEFQKAYDAIQESYLGSYNTGHYADIEILNGIKNLAIMSKCIGDNTVYKHPKE